MSRTVNYRNKRPEEVRRKQDEANDATVYLLKEYGPTSFLVQDENQRKFRVHIGESHSCTCTIFKATGELCVHLCWIMLKRFRLDANNPLSWQLGLVEREIRDLLDGKHTRSAGAGSKLAKVADEDPGDGTESRNGLVKQRRIGPDDLCPICQDELLSESRLPVTYCRTGCGNSVHIRCMRVWADHQRKQKAISLSEAVPCPICREEFAPLGLLLREASEDSQLKCTKKVANKHTNLLSLPPIPYHKAAHPSTRCMMCDGAPIAGNLYRCQHCFRQSGDETNSLICADCFKTNQHAEHNLFVFRETPHSKWAPVNRHSCMPINLEKTLVQKFALNFNANGSHSWHKRDGPCETLRSVDLSILPQWTVRIPRWSQLDRRMSHKHTSANNNVDAGHQSETAAATGDAYSRVSGTEARVQKWGHIKSTGLLAPGRQCRICLMAFQVGDIVRRLNPGCQHVFHTACIDPWLLHRSGSCPIDGISVSPSSSGNQNSPSKFNKAPAGGQFAEPPDLESISICASALRARACKTVLKTSPLMEAKDLPEPIINRSLGSVSFGVVGHSMPTACKHPTTDRATSRSATARFPLECSPLVRKWRPPF